MIGTSVRCRVAVTGRPEKFTVDLRSRELYAQLKSAAVQNEMSLEDIVAEAVEFWLNHQDLVEDTLAAEKMDRVAAQSGGEYIPQDEVKRRLAQ
jgi:hypothetical protein